MPDVRVPKPGDAIKEAILTAIHVPDGSRVTEGAPLYTIETDKIEMEIEAPADGTVRGVVAVGGTYPVGELVAVIE